MVGASERNLSIHERRRPGQTRPGWAFRDTGCLTWLAARPGYRATVVCSQRLQSRRYFLTKFLCHTFLQLYLKRQNTAKNEMHVLEDTKITTKAATL